MPHGHLPLVVFQEQPSGRGTQGRPRTRWRDYISHLVWEFLRIPQGRAGKRCWAHRHMENPAWPAATATWPQDGRRMDRWEESNATCQWDKLMRCWFHLFLLGSSADGGTVVALLPHSKKVLSLNLTGAWPFSLHVLPVLVRVSSRPLTEALLKNEHVRCHVAWLVALLQLGMSSHPRTILVQGPWALNCRWIRAISYWSVIWVIYYCCSQKKSVALPSQQTVGENVSH